MYGEHEAFNWMPIIVISLILFVLIIAYMLLYPIYNVWKSHKNGEAELAQAKNEQNIQIAEAQSRLNAAELNKKAAIIEAEAVAKQIEVIGNNLTKHDLYLKWQWIKMMEEREGSTIYVPTEANLPILEANRNKN
jgi:thioesterase domain-containing protein